MNKLRGTGIALITPFNQDRSIDYPALEKLVDYSTKGGVEYLVCLGTTAETPTLTKDEKKQIVSTIKSANAGKLPLILGIGGNNTEEIKQEFKDTDLSDFTAVLSASPAYNKPNQEGIYQHYKILAENTDADIILYNVPGRTGSNMETATTLRLANDLKNIIAIKEASPNFLQSTEILKDKPDGFEVISGDDEFGLPMTLAGGKGVISVIAQGLPEQYTEMIRLGLDRKVDEAYKLHYKLMEITRAIYVEGNPAGIKSLLTHKGICKPYTRLPLVHASDDLSNKIKTLLEKI
ncbi:4-hydroxy-tetrahydrodipicolinate synthase [Moheibacter sediminis]|uniref:4-hydroxy-tetrahydrodipicolinate synthase n=1 Tax=Moheibacter sediminis TaxID=1434700 RepID=A0A1W2AES2_9FLAO|nr:4-hydroxy-tetrahydrodipicolinate synthase [Moheibacter sediminis]SMC59187.1 4-hydroxy-tetrahydrodipicolinate synthase [Moheibacter sediminis]